MFLVVLPLALVLWARRLDQILQLPAWGGPFSGLAIALFGATLMLLAARDLWVWGGGLPMSPFPPPRLVNRGLYAVLAHPIYTGAVLVALGIALATRSPAGVWVVTPTLLLAIVAWVIGYEREMTRARHGATPQPLLRMPPAENNPPILGDVASIYILVLLPWLVAYLAVEYLGTPAGAPSAYFQWERRLPVIPWTEAIYAFTYPLVVLAPLVARARRDLRRLATGGLWATAVIIPFYLVFPVVALARPVVGMGFWDDLLRWERLNDAAVTAFPAFHVIWTWLAARVYAARWPRLAWLWWGIVAAVAISCITTGMHAVVDVAAGLVACVLIARAAGVWEMIRRGSETVANSWGEVTIGPVRLLSHGSYAAVGAVSALTIAAGLAGPAYFGWLVAMWVAAVIGACLWGQLVEGSPQLLRPYGYFGAAVGVVAVFLAALVSGADAWVIFAAMSVGATVAQALGRLRCLVQGCCHGRPSPAWLGIRYTHPRSRVLRLAQLGGVPLHATPVYSILWTLCIGAVLWRLWMLAVPLSVIPGVYFLLVGAGRFVEEHFRGEPQTAVVGGLRLYQWLAVLFVVGGAALMAVGSAPAPPPAGLDLGLLPALLSVGLVTLFAYGVDFPGSGVRFSRLV